MKPMFDVFQSFYHFGKKSLQFAFLKDLFVQKGGGEGLLRLPPAHAPGSTYSLSSITWHMIMYAMGRLCINII
jgi:hypothetical protein